MHYVCSDLHGFPVETFKQILSNAGFNGSDFLWVLGDVIDRGSDGIKILKWLMAQPNAQLILGNHEAMLIQNELIFEDDIANAISRLTGTTLENYNIWLSNSGESTIRELEVMRKSEIKYILEYLHEAPLYKELRVNGKDFILTHSGLGNFSSDKKLTDYSHSELLWNRPKITDRYFDDIMTVFGHTPTLMYSNEYKGRILKTETWIDIDCAVGLGLNPGLLRLEDMAEFYFNEKKNDIK